jgi:Mg2+ and Co2+ transporter CorA
MTSPRGGRVRARLLDADHPDRWLDQDELARLEPSDRQLLWIDITGTFSAAMLEHLRRHIELVPRTRAALERSGREPFVALHGEYLHVRVAVDPSDDGAEQGGWLDAIAGKKVVLTRHDEPVPFLDEMDERIQRDATAGILSTVAFFAALIDGAITSYHTAVDRIEDDVDDLDAVLLRGRAGDELLHDLVVARRRIARLRRLLADHRSIFTALASPEIGGVLDDPEAVSLLQGLGARYDGAMGAVEDSRDALLGSFDIYMSRTAQRTNEIVKVLTIVTVLLLPGSMIAGLMGMNVVVPLDKDDPLSFWMVVGALALLAVLIVVAARLRRWI